MSELLNVLDGFRDNPEAFCAGRVGDRDLLAALAVDDEGGAKEARGRAALVGDLDGFLVVV